MTWNIQDLSIRKIQVLGMAEALARTVVGAGAEVLIVQEVCKVKVTTTMEMLSAALQAADPLARNPADPRSRNVWRGYFLSEETGVEHYCAFIRDLDLIRPLHRIGGPGPQDTWPRGTAKDPLRDLTCCVFAAWPHANWGRSAYDQDPFTCSRRFPVCEVFVRPRHERAAKRARYAGQPQPRGFARGHGSRLPALMPLWIRTGSAGCLVPIVVSHNASAYRKKVNRLAMTQLEQLACLHVAQLYDSDPGGLSPGASGYLDVRNAADRDTAVGVQELCILGDFNLDFLLNSDRADPQSLPGANRRAFERLTPTSQRGGSASPPAAPGVLPTPRSVPFEEHPEARSIDDVGAQRLRAAITQQATIQRIDLSTAPPPAPPPPEPAPYGSAALDNVFYGGTRLRTASAQYKSDAGSVVNVAERIVQGTPVAPGEINIAATAREYAQRGRKKADQAPHLRSAEGDLTPAERLIGARLLSDHLPVVLQFECS